MGRYIGIWIICCKHLFHHPIGLSGFQCWFTINQMMQWLHFCLGVQGPLCLLPVDQIPRCPTPLPSCCCLTCHHFLRQWRCLAQPLFLWILKLNWIMNVAFYCVTIKLTMSGQALDCVTFNFTLLEESWHNICTALFDAFFQFASLFSLKLHFSLSIQVLSCVGEHGGYE